MNVSGSIRRIPLVVALTTLVVVGLASPRAAGNDAPFSFAGGVTFVDTDKLDAMATPRRARQWNCALGYLLPAWTSSPSLASSRMTGVNRHVA